MSYYGGYVLKKAIDLYKGLGCLNLMVLNYITC